MNWLPRTPRSRASAGVFPVTLVVDNRRRSARKGASGRLRYLHCGDFTDNQRPGQPADGGKGCGVGFGYDPTLPLTWATLAKMVKSAELASASAGAEPVVLLLSLGQMEPSGGLEPQPRPVQSRPQRLARGCQMVGGAGIEPAASNSADLQPAVRH